MRSDDVGALRHASRTAPRFLLPSSATCLSAVPSENGGPVGLGLPPPRNPYQRARAHAAQALFHVATASIRGAANQERLRYGLPPLSQSVSELAGEMPLYLVAGSPEFDYGRTHLPKSVRYIGPCLSFKESDKPCPEWIESSSRQRPVVHVTEGTVHADEPFLLRAANEGLGDGSMQIVMATGTHRRPEDLGLSPDDSVGVEGWVTIGVCCHARIWWSARAELVSCCPR